MQKWNIYVWSQSSMASPFLYDIRFPKYSKRNSPLLKSLVAKTPKPETVQTVNRTIDFEHNFGKYCPILNLSLFRQKLSAHKCVIEFATSHMICCRITLKNATAYSFYRAAAHWRAILSVHDVPVSDENGLIYCHSSFHHTAAQSF